MVKGTKATELSGDTFGTVLNELAPLKVDFQKIQKEASDAVREEQFTGQISRPKRGTKKRELYDDSYETQKTKEKNKMKRLAMLEKKKAAAAAAPPPPPPPPAPPMKKREKKSRDKTLKLT